MIVGRSTLFVDDDLMIMIDSTRQLTGLPVKNEDSEYL
jgi:hypothetical protein